MGRSIDLLKPPSEELLGMEGVIFCKPIQVMNLTNVDSDGKNDIKVIFEMHLGAGEDGRLQVMKLIQLIVPESRMNLKKPKCLDWNTNMNI